MPDHPGLAQNQPKTPAFKVINGALHIRKGGQYVKAPKTGPKAGDKRGSGRTAEYYDGSKWVKGRYTSTRFKR